VTPADVSLLPQQLLTALVLPPLGLVLASLLGGLLAWRGWRPGGLLVMASALSLGLLSTPFVSGLLMESLEREVRLVPAAQAGGTARMPAAIVILGAEMAHGEEGADVGPMTLERLRAGAALHRRTGLPVLVTGGVLSRDTPAIATLMQRSLETDFATPTRWVEAEAPDTRGNAQNSAVLLREAGIDTAYVVTHAWHLPRALEAFARAGIHGVAAPVRTGHMPDSAWTDWVPRPDHLSDSWFALREWVGRLVYAIRD
jgi:uncharacterized SAM-binding protein YcdF (DUF218 family)